MSEREVKSADGTPAHVERTQEDTESIDSRVSAIRQTLFSGVRTLLPPKVTSDRLRYLILLVSLVVAEALHLAGHPESGLVVHAITALAILGSVQYSSAETAPLFQSLFLVPLLRVISLGLPSVAGSPISNLAIVYTLVAVSAILIVRSLRLGFERLGGGLVHTPYLAPGVLAGVPLGIAQYLVVPGGLSVKTTPGDFLPAVAGLALFMAFVEELVFRGLIQRQAEHAFGTWPAVLSVSILFGAMQSVWLSSPNVLFMGAVGLLLGWIYARWRNLWLVVGIHWGINLGVLLLAPLYTDFLVGILG